MNIPNELVSISYSISKRVYEKEISFKDGKEELAGNSRMNKNSAADYINNFEYMMEGKRFTRTLNAYSMEYYLDNFFQDYGVKGLSNALTALKLHIEYYENLRKVTMHKMRGVYEKYYTNPIISHNEQEQNELINILTDSKQNLLNELLNLKEFDSAEIIISGKRYKRDNKTVAQIKLLRDFQCQICSKTIIKKDGSKYIEAAHIKPKHQKGRETLDNIILLCPNHHKEFDFGDRKIFNHTKTSVDFSINGEKYYISFVPVLSVTQ